METSFKQDWLHQQEVWERDPDIDPSHYLYGLGSEVNLTERWKISPTQTKPVTAPIIAAKAEQRDFPSSIMPEAEPYGPTWDVQFELPGWLQTLAGAPAYVSVNLYVVLTGPPNVQLDRSPKGTHTLQVNFGKLFDALKVTAPLMRYVSPNIMYLRLVAYGLLQKQLNNLLRMHCVIRTTQTVGTWPTYSVNYHAIVACGTQQVTPVDSFDLYVNEDHFSESQDSKKLNPLEVEWVKV